MRGMKTKVLVNKMRGQVKISPQMILFNYGYFPINIDTEAQDWTRRYCEDGISGTWFEIVQVNEDRPGYITSIEIAHLH